MKTEVWWNGTPILGGHQTWCTSMVILKDLPQKIVCIAWVGNIVTPIFVTFGIWQGGPRMWRLTRLWMLVPLYFRMAFHHGFMSHFLSERERERRFKCVVENWKPASSSILLTTNHYSLRGKYGSPESFNAGNAPVSCAERDGPPPKRLPCSFITGNVVIWLINNPPQIITLYNLCRMFNHKSTWRVLNAMKRLILGFDVWLIRKPIQKKYWWKLNWKWRHWIGNA